MQSCNKIIILVLIILLAANGLVAQFAGGSGTATDPYQISTAEHLNNIRNYLGNENSDKYFTMLNDIDLTAYLSEGGAGYAVWGSAGWLPIGTIYFDSASSSSVFDAFEGKFYGNNKKITGLIINRATEKYIGLFGYTGNNVLILDIGIEISSSGYINGSDRVGGLVGDNGGTITNCYVIGDIGRSNSNRVGGIVGFNSGSITNCFTSGTVSGDWNVGGLVGYNYYYGSINKSYATGIISGTGNYVGGLVGCNQLYNSMIINCYATGAVSGGNYVGGLTGENYGVIENCYATGFVQCTSGHSGGITGCNTTESPKRSYWDKQTTGQATSSGSNPSFGKTTAEMKTQATYSEWSFNYIWSINANINNGYPFLIYTPLSIDKLLMSKTSMILSNYPNPFNPSTTITYDLQSANCVKVVVYNSKGELVKTLANGIQNAGKHSLTFDGSGLNSGIYICSLEVDGKSIVQKMILCK